MSEIGSRDASASVCFRPEADMVAPKFWLPQIGDCLINECRKFFGVGSLLVIPNFDAELVATNYPAGCIHDRARDVVPKQSLSVLPVGIVLISQKSAKV